MFHDSQAENRLNQAIQELQAAQVGPDRLEGAEERILAQVALQKKRPRFSWPLVALGSAGLAAALVGAALLLPSKSLAAELKVIAANGDKGLRHVAQWGVGADGLEQKIMEWYVMDDQARWIPGHSGDQYVLRLGETRHCYPDGAVTITHFKPEQGQKLLDFIGFSVKEVMDHVAGRKNARIKEELHVLVEGYRVNRYTSESDFQDQDGKMVHNRTVLLVDPKAERLIREESRTTGRDPVVYVWGYPKGGRELVEGPKADPARTYDIDAERSEILASLDSAGPAQTVHGHRIELASVWVDELGSVAAVTKSDLEYPSNYSVRVNGQIAGDLPQEASEASHYHVVLPSRYHGHATQIYYGTRSPGGSAVKWPDRVDLEIPVVEGAEIVAYALFKDVPVHQTYEISTLLSPNGGMDMPFWDMWRNAPAPSPAMDVNGS